MSLMKRRVPSSFTPAILLSVAALALSGCGSSSNGSSAPSSEVQAVSSATPAATTPDGTTPTPTPSTTERTPPSAEDSTATTTSPDPTESESATSGSRGEGAPDATLPTDRTLTIGDIFRISSYDAKENLYDVATAEGQKGIGIPLGSGGVEEVELRLGNRHEELTFNVGQDNNSESSDRIVEVQIEKNGESDEIYEVPFNEVTPITVDVKNVNALKITLKTKPREGADRVSGTVTVVLYDMKVR